MIRARLGRRGERLAVLGLLLAAIVEILVQDVERPLWAALLLAAGWTLPLLLRPRHPLLGSLLVLGAVLGASVLFPSAMERSSTLVAAIMAAFFCIAYETPRAVFATGAIAGFGLALAAMAVGEGRLTLADVFFVVVLCLAPSLAAVALGRTVGRTAALAERADALERERRERVRAAAAEERTRIAGELHAVIANSISLMTVQAGAARVLVHEDPIRARAAIVAVEEQGREALAETRRLLGILRRETAGPEKAPQVGLADLDALLDRARADGLRVEIDVDGAVRPLPPAVDRAAYRVVEEAVDLARRAIGTTVLRVSLGVAGGAVEIAIEEDGRSSAPAERELTAEAVLRERVEPLAGTLRVASLPGGGSRIDVRLPLGAVP